MLHDDTSGGPARRATPLTTITPMRAGWATFQRLVFQVFPYTRFGGGTDLEDLAFIHSARWAVVRDLWVGGRPHRPRYDYLLFESNFDGALAAYIEAFTDVLGDRMRLVWNSSYGFPNLPEDEGRSVVGRLRRPIPGRTFVDYVRRTDLGAHHYFSAHDATTREILQGLAARDALADGRGAAAALSVMRGPVVRARQPAGCLGDVRGDHVAFTAFTPVVPGREASLRELLTGLRDSPFAAVPGLHHARWVLVDDLPECDGQARDAWPRAYLLLTATLDRAAVPTRQGAPDPAEHLHRHLPRVADDVYAHCEDYPRREFGGGMSAYLERHRVRSLRFYSGYPHVDVHEVGAGLAARADVLARAGSAGATLHEEDRP